MMHAILLATVCSRNIITPSTQKTENIITDYSFIFCIHFFLRRNNLVISSKFPKKKHNKLSIDLCTKRVNHPLRNGRFYKCSTSENFKNI